MPEAKTRWFDMLRIELDAMDERDLIDPDTDAAPGERIVGTASPDIKRLYTRVCQLRSEALRAHADLATARGGREREAATARTFELREKRSLTTQSMWACIRDEFNLWNSGTIGIRSGWKIVVEPDAGPAAILGQFPFFGPYA